MSKPCTIDKSETTLTLTLHRNGKTIHAEYWEKRINCYGEPYYALADSITTKQAARAVNWAYKISESIGRKMVNFCA